MMSVNFDTALSFAKSDDGANFPGQEQAGCERSAYDADRVRSADAASATQKVWRDYLTQHDVHSAIMTVTTSAPEVRRHAFFVGFDEARGEPIAVQYLLAFAERLWAQAGEQAAHQFQVSGTNLLSEFAADHGVGPQGHELLAGFDRGVATQMRHNGATIKAVYFRKYGLGRFSSQEIGALQLILPLFADAAVGGAQLARQSERSAMLEAMFDRVSLSMALLSADSQPLFLNSAATAMLDERKWLIRSADGSISSTNAKQAKELRESIRLAASEAENGPTEAVYRLDCANGEWRLAYVMPAMSRSGSAKTRCAMLIVMGPGKMDAPTQMLEALGLLPSEQRFLGRFLKSSSLCNAAEDCGLSEETARTYLKRVRAKLGVHRQMELAGLISGLVLPIQAANQSTVGD
jgi:DNA-binding NarL/FixJ family response regulator